MYRYTPNKNLLKSLHLARTKPYAQNGGADWTLAKSLGLTDYTMTCLFLRYWEHVDFYSPFKRTHVPVLGHLFPVTFFEELNLH